MMGWWQAPERPEIVTSDTVLDMIRHLFHDFSHVFQDELKRKPTVAELEYALSLAFKVNLDQEVLAGFDELESKQVVIKTSKRKKRQKVSPGDIFAYKLDDGRFGFGRIVANNSIGSIAEIFDYLSQSPIFDHSRESTWLIPPIPIESYGLLEDGSIGDWRIIEHHPEYIPDETLDSLRYIYGTPPHALIAVDIHDKECPVSATEAEGLPEYYAHDDFHFKALIMRHLAEKASSD